MATTWDTQTEFNAADDRDNVISEGGSITLFDDSTGQDGFLRTSKRTL